MILRIVFSTPIKVIFSGRSIFSANKIFKQIKKLYNSDDFFSFSGTF